MPARVIGGYRGATTDHESNGGKHAYAPSPDKDGLWTIVLTDAQWAKMEPHCRGRSRTPVGAARITGGLSRRYCGLREPAAPGATCQRFGRWNTVFKRYRDWVKADVFKRLFDAASDEPDMEYAMVDATIVKVHRHGQGAKGGLRARPSAAPRAA